MGILQMRFIKIASQQRRAFQGRTFQNIHIGGFSRLMIYQNSWTGEIRQPTLGQRLGCWEEIETVKEICPCILK